MQEIVEFFTANPVQYLATVGADGKAKCRPFMFLMERGGKLWFGTNNQKTVFAEMQENPYVEVCTSAPDFQWIRLGGKAVFEDNRAVKEACMNIPLLKDQYQTADNPIFEVFYLTDGEATIADMTGQCAYGGKAVDCFIERRHRTGFRSAFPLRESQSNA